MPNNPNATDNLTPFAPGQSGNPNGRPTKTVSQLLREYGAATELAFTIEKTDAHGNVTQSTARLSAGGELTLNQAIAARLLQAALKGDLKAIREVLDRTEGKAKQSVEVSGGMTAPVTFFELPCKQQIP